MRFRQQRNLASDCRWAGHFEPKLVGRLHVAEALLEKLRVHVRFVRVTKGSHHADDEQSVGAGG